MRLLPSYSPTLRSKPSALSTRLSGQREKVSQIATEFTEKSLSDNKLCQKPAWNSGLEKSEERGVQAARNGPSEDKKWWQRIELGIQVLNR